MTKNSGISSKHLQIDKANASMVVAVAISSFIVVFSLISVKALISQRNYQARVIEKKEAARDQLIENIKASESLKNSYVSFVGTAQNILGGNPTGNGEKDGDNAKIILDALPSKYDYPALTTSVEKLVLSNGLKIESISGTDDQISQQNNSSVINPKPIDMPFILSVNGPYDRLKKVISVFETSIRPFNSSIIKLSASDDNKVDLEYTAKSYFQPSKSLNNDTVVVK